MNQKTTHMRDYRKRKREQGICTYGGCWATSEKTYCTAHREITNLKALGYKRRRPTNPPKVCLLIGCVDFVKYPALKYCPAHSNTTSYFSVRLRGQVVRGLCHQGSCKNTPVEGITLCETHHEISRIKNRLFATRVRASKQHFELSGVS
jgi:hypothetical protein